MYRIWGNGKQVSAPQQQDGARLVDMFASFPDPVLILDEQGGELARNEACTHIFAHDLPESAAIRRILAHHAQGKARGIWPMQITERGKGEFRATIHPVRDAVWGHINVLILQRVGAGQK